MMYFAQDGSFGDATGLLTLSPEWFASLPEDIQENISYLGDGARYAYVDHLAKDLHKNGFATCQTCQILLGA